MKPSDLSIARPPFRQCPGCKIGWEPDLWVVVDLDHRLDLIERIRGGTLHLLQCTSCAARIAVNSSILAVRGRNPRLLFSPSPGSTSLDDHNQLVHSLWLLQQAMGSEWDHSLLQKVAIVARPLLINAIDESPSHSAGQLVEALIQANNGWKQQYLFAGCPDIYRPEVVEQLDKLIVDARQARDSSRLATLQGRRGLLENCRLAGAVEIQALLPSPHAYDPQLELNAVLNFTAGAILSGKPDFAVSGFLRSVGLDEQHNRLLWAEARIAMAQLSESGDENLTQLDELAYQAVAAADLPFGPWLVCAVEAHTHLAALAVNVEEAIAHHEAAISGLRALGDDLRLVGAYDALGYLHYTRWKGHADPASLDAALACFRAGARLADREMHPGNWAAMQFNVGNAFLEKETGDSLSNLDQAIAHLERAADVQASQTDKEVFSETVGRLQLARVLHLKVRCERDPRSADLARALAALEQRNWEDALSAYRSVIAQNERMVALEFTEERRREVFGDFGSAYAAAAYACFRLARFDEATSLMEAGRSRVLSEEIEAFDVDIAQLSSTLREELESARRGVRLLRTTKFVATKASRQDIAAEKIHEMNRRALTELAGVMSKIREVAPEAINAEIETRRLASLCPEGGALVLPVFSIAGCCVLVLPHGRSEPTVEDLLWIDDFTDNDLLALLFDWSESQSTEARAGRRNGAAGMCERLWQALACHLAHRLEALQLAVGAPIVVLPQGGLGLLPLSAAAPKPEQGGGLLDRYAISFAPSLRLLSLMQRRASDRVGTADTLVAVGDPLGDLTYARAEGMAVASFFPADRVTLLNGNDASGQRLTGAVVAKKYLHLSCHAYYTTAGGNYAGLYLAHDVLSLSSEELMAAVERRPALTRFFLAGHRWIPLSLDLSQCRLVTLSACESGNTDLGIPDEFLGLPAAFLRAGAAAVIGTTWRVDDVATMLLMQKLYEGLVRDGLSPAGALRGAQCWLRDVTNESLARHYRSMRDSGNPPLAAIALERELRRHALGSPKERPFSHPYFWAAFVVYGSQPWSDPAPLSQPRRNPPSL